MPVLTEFCHFYFRAFYIPAVTGMTCLRSVAASVLASSMYGDSLCKASSLFSLLVAYYWTLRHARVCLPALNSVSWPWLSLRILTSPSLMTLRPLATINQLKITFYATYSSYSSTFKSTLLKKLNGVPRTYQPTWLPAVIRPDVSKVSQP